MTGGSEGSAAEGSGAGVSAMLAARGRRRARRGRDVACARLLGSLAGSGTWPDARGQTHERPCASAPCGPLKDGRVVRVLRTLVARLLRKALSAAAAPPRPGRWPRCRPRPRSARRRTSRRPRRQWRRRRCQRRRRHRPLRRMWLPGQHHRLRRCHRQPALAQALALSRAHVRASTTQARMFVAPAHALTSAARARIEAVTASATK